MRASNRRDRQRSVSRGAVSACPQEFSTPKARRQVSRKPTHVEEHPWSESDRITLTVADHGPGIATADRGRVVERFVRLEQSRSQPGSGLGLSLAAAVARLHGGELKLEDNEPGLKSIIALPRAGPSGG